MFERGRILLNDVKILVIDEADRMLDMGFIPDVERIVSLLPQIRQTLFFSATMPPEIRRLADAFLSNPKEITVSRARLARPRPSAQALVTVGSDDKREALRRLIRQRAGQERARFSATASATSTCCTRRSSGTASNVGALHGDMEQSTRTATLEAFKRGEITILVVQRRRRARPRHRRPVARLQFRRADPRRGLRPPHRPHRPRGQERPRLHAGDAAKTASSSMRSRS